MEFWFGIIVGGLIAAVALRIAYVQWKKARIVARRVVEKPNSHYASKLVQDQVDRARWAQVDLNQIHPVNREEVERLLAVADVQGPDALSTRERLFLENMTRLSFS
jgi:hypothetical protein